MKPPLAYFGGKSMLADRIVAMFPPHQHYVEPFAGSLAVLLAKPASRMETVNDLDSDLVTFWSVLRDRPDELIRACALTPHSRVENLVTRDRPSDLTDLERARRVWVQLSQSRGGTLRNTGWRYCIDPNGFLGSSMPATLSSYVDRMAAAAERLHNVSLECRPALEIIVAYGQHRDVLLYVDPPYLRSTRTSRQYQCEMSTDAEHRDLAEALFDCKATVVLSGYASPLYTELYDSWHVTSMSTATTQGGKRGARTEVLWCNRPPEPDLFGAVIA